MRGSKSRRGLRHADRGSAAVVGLMVGLTVFSFTFYYVADTVIDRDVTTAGAESSNANAIAASLVDTIFRSGAGWYSAPPCVTTMDKTSLDTTKFSPDGVAEMEEGVPSGRFGLGEESCLRSATDPAARNNISYDKLLNLYNAKSERDADNGHVDYDEARESLGLDKENLDFHLRAWPLLPSVHQILADGIGDPFFRPLYIGDYIETKATEETVEHTVSTADQSDRIVITVSITNDGTTATIFAVLFEIPLDQNTVDFSLHTPLLASDESYELQVTIRKSAGWTWDDDNEKWIDYEIQDKDTSVGSGRIDLSGVSMTDASTVTNVIAEADKLYWELDEDDVSVDLKMNYLAFRGDGKKQKFSDWTLLTLNPLGLPLPAVALPNKDEDGDVTQPAVMVGTYSGEIKNDLLTAVWNVDRMNVVSDDIEGYTTTGSGEYAPSEAAATETAYLDTLVDQFSPHVFDPEFDHADLTWAVGGDVYPDLKDVMNNDLFDALTGADGDPSYAEYNILIVGSNVDHNAMTSSAAKDTIADWVLGGGTLLVFGSDDQHVTWLQPIFQSQLETANGGLHTPDEDHPVLHTPNDLDYSNYQYSTEWSYNSDAEEGFTHVIFTGSGGDVLAVSDPGAFEAGRILLSSYRPYDLVLDQAAMCPEPLEPEDDCEALFLLHNLLTLSYRYLFIDYGPEIPTEAVSGSVMRLATSYHPELHELIPIHVQVFVF